MIKLLVILIIMYMFIRKSYTIIINSIEKYNNKSNTKIHIFHIQIVDNTISRKQGLMNVKYLKDKHGMLFDFKKNQKIILWMKNTIIPLDAIFLDKNGYIVYIIKNMKPNSLKNHKSKKKSRYVLEVNAGTVDKYKININDKIQTILLKKNITKYRN